MSPSRPDFPLPAAAAAPRSNSEREGLSWRLGRRGASESAEDGVIAQGGEQFPGDEGLERDDALALDPRPFRMRSRQHDEARAGIGDSEDFRLLAPHHIRQSGVVDIRQSRSERDAPAVGLDLGKMRSDVARPGGTFDVRRLAPAMPAADHARGDDRERRMRVEPPPHEPLERGWIGPRRHAPDPVAGGDLIEDLGLPPT